MSMIMNDDGMNDELLISHHHHTIIEVMTHWQSCLMTCHDVGQAHIIIFMSHAMKWWIWDLAMAWAWLAHHAWHGALNLHVAFASSELTPAFKIHPIYAPTIYLINGHRHQLSKRLQSEWSIIKSRCRCSCHPAKEVCDPLLSLTLESSARRTLVWPRFWFYWPNKM